MNKKVDMMKWKECVTNLDAESYDEDFCISPTLDELYKVWQQTEPKTNEHFGLICKCIQEIQFLYGELFEQNKQLEKLTPQTKSAYLGEIEKTPLINATECLVEPSSAVDDDMMKNIGTIPQECVDNSGWKLLSECDDVEFLRTEVERLWDILDSIDSLPDMIHPTTLPGYISYFKGVESRHRMRHERTTSLDGYGLSVKVK